MKRGEVWWASLPDPGGPGPGYRRPVLIVQSNAFNDSRLSTVIVASITSNLNLGEAPGNVRVTPADTGLPRPSVVNVSQVLTVDRRYLTECLRALPPLVLSRVDDGLALVLGF